MVINIVVQDSRGQGTQLSHGGTETVRGGSDGDGEDFGGDQESRAVGTELLEEPGKEVNRLEAVDVCGFSEVVVGNGGNKLSRGLALEYQSQSG